MKHCLVVFLLQATSCLAFLSRAPTPKVAPVARRTNLFASANEGSPLNFLQGIFSSPSSAAVAEPEPQIPDVVIDKDYTLAAAFAVVGISIIALNHGVGGVLGGGFVTLLASLFAVQATRLRFVFDRDSFELKALDSIEADELKDSGENVFVGGKNRWAYKSFVNYDFYPSAATPILVYFKETQTSDDGQIHFFPAIANVKQLKEQFELRGCAKVSND